MENCCYICTHFVGRKGQETGACPHISKKHLYRFSEGNDVWFRDVIVQGRCVCEEFKEIVLE